MTSHSADASYKLLFDNEDDAEVLRHHLGTSRKSISSYLWWALLFVQSALVVGLLWTRPHRKLAGHVPYLYSPAEDAIEYEVKNFVFGIGGELSPFQRSPSPELDKMWQDLYSFGVSRIPKHQARLLPNKTAPIPGDKDGYYIVQLEVFHQLHCLNMIRQALYPDHYPSMRLGTPKADEHVGHCIDTLRQSLMCTSDTSAVVWQWDEKAKMTGFNGGVAHTCRNFDAIRDWAKERTLEGTFHAEVRVEDDIRVPIYRTDGSSYFP